jgi:hypothetical protein
MSLALLLDLDETLIEGRDRSAPEMVRDVPAYNVVDGAGSALRTLEALVVGWVGHTN